MKTATATESYKFFALDDKKGEMCFREKGRKKKSDLWRSRENQFLDGFIFGTSPNLIKREIRS